MTQKLCCYFQYVYLSFLPFTLHAFGWREPEWLAVAHCFSNILNEKSNPLLSCVQLNSKYSSAPKYYCSACILLRMFRLILNLAETKIK